jgi:hypothetical protein
MPPEFYPLACEVAEPDIQVSVTSLSSTLCPDSSELQTFEISNIGDLALDWAITEDGSIPWLSEDPTAGTLQPGEAVVVSVTFDTAGMTPGDYLGQLLIDSNDPDTPQIELPVSLTVRDDCVYHVYLPIVFKGYVP